MNGPGAGAVFHDCPSWRRPIRALGAVDELAEWEPWSSTVPGFMPAQGPCSRPGAVAPRRAGRVRGCRHAGTSGTGRRGPRDRDGRLRDGGGASGGGGRGRDHRGGHHRVGAPGRDRVPASRGAPGGLVGARGHGAAGPPTHASGPITSKSSGMRRETGSWCSGRRSAPMRPPRPSRVRSRTFPSMTSPTSSSTSSGLIHHPWLHAASRGATMAST